MNERIDSHVWNMTFHIHDRVSLRKPNQEVIYKIIWVIALFNNIYLELDLIEVKFYLF